MGSLITNAMLKHMIQKTQVSIWTLHLEWSSRLYWVKLKMGHQSLRTSFLCTQFSSLWMKLLRALMRKRTVSKHQLVISLRPCLTLRRWRRTRPYQFSLTLTFEWSSPTQTSFLELFQGSLHMTSQLSSKTTLRTWWAFSLSLFESRA